MNRAEVYWQIELQGRFELAISDVTACADDVPAEESECPAAPNSRDTDPQRSTFIVMHLLITPHPSSRPSSSTQRCLLLPAPSHLKIRFD